MQSWCPTRVHMDASFGHKISFAAVQHSMNTNLNHSHPYKYIQQAPSNLARTLFYHAPTSHGPLFSIRESFVYSFTTLNCPCPPLFLSIPLVPGPPCCLLCSLKCPLSISCLPAFRTRSFWACCSGVAWKRRSTEELRVPRRVSPTPCLIRS